MQALSVLAVADENFDVEDPHGGSCEDSESESEAPRAATARRGTLVQQPLRLMCNPLNPVFLLRVWIPPYALCIYDVLQNAIQSVQVAEGGSVSRAPQLQHLLVQ